MNILFVLEYYPPHLGGIQVVFENLAERLAERGHDITVVTSRTGQTEMSENRNGVQISRSPVVDRVDRYTFTLSGIPKAIQHARQADVIHTSTWTGAVPGWIAKQITQTPSVMTVHEVFAPKWDDTDLGPVSARLHKLLEQGLYRLPFDHYTTVSEYTKRELTKQGKPEEEIDVIYNGIDTELFDPGTVDPNRMKKKLDLEDQFVYTYFGRPGPFKGVEYLVQAASGIHDQISDATLLLILSRHPQDRYEMVLELIRDLGIADHVTIIDPVERSELPQYVGGSDCVVVPSISEGFGFTAAEACALEVPVVATTAGSLPEVVSGTHRLVEPADPQSLTEGVLDIYHDGADNRSKRIFDWERAVDEYLAIYKKVR
jgi:glycosyltransferase involved in cell wall biosynthesis